MFSLVPLTFSLQVHLYFYRIGSHYYITNSEKITSDDYANAIKASAGSAGKVFIDGWTASLNGTLQNYKEDVKIVF